MSTRRHGIGRRRWRASVLAVASLAALGFPSGAAVAAASPQSPVKHVFIVVLENARASEVTGPRFSTTMPYLASLAAKGVTLDQMYAIGHASLGNYIALTSGYAPNPKTSADCFLYDCIYPAGQDDNVANQLEAKHRTWKAYLDGIDQPCQHPLFPGTPDPYQSGYATRHNPFVYYASIVDDATRCRNHVVPFPRLATDLAVNRAPSYAFISPSTCHDAHDRGSSCGLERADVWMSQHVQPILTSKAYQDGGVLIITTDESEINHTSGCCGNAAGGHIATFIVSPLIARPGSHTTTAYTHYSTLRWIENSFGLACLRHACDSRTSVFGSDIFNAVASTTVKTATS